VGSDLIVRPNLLPRSDIRYKKWKESLKKRPPPWNKGENKETHPSVRKTSETFKRNKIDNFARWRERARKDGLLSNYQSFEKDKNLALLIGLVLGDGNIYEFPRTEKLTMALGTDKPGLIVMTSDLLRSTFNKKPGIYKPKNQNVIKLSIYEKHISSRLGVPVGNRRYSKKGIPGWIWTSKGYILACLRGLYEAEGSLNIHKPTYTYNFSFSNRNCTLLSEVKKALILLKLHPETRQDAIRLRRKDEVKYFKSLIKFRKYNAG
jgi:hypothetical protein